MLSAKICSMPCTEYRDFEMRISDCEFEHCDVMTRFAIRNPKFEIYVPA